MLYDLKIRVKTPVVGNTWDDKRRMFIFPREDGAWCLDINLKHVWNGLLENAIESLGLPVSADTVRWPRTLLLPTIHLLEINSAPGRQQRPARHESIPRNVVLTIPLMIRHTDGEGPLAFPDIKQLHDIFTIIGAHEGISPFGGAAGYGLFSVQDVRPRGRTAIDLGELSEGLLEGADVCNQGAAGRQSRA